jgi:hypothetical protein
VVLAFGVLQAARYLGTTVPAQLAVTGWDDSAAAAAAGLTTIAQSLRDQGELCARSVVEPATTAPTRTTPSWRLVTRASTGHTLPRAMRRTPDPSSLGLSPRMILSAIATTSTALSASRKAR